MKFWGCAEQIWAVLTDCPGGRKDSGTWSWRQGPWQILALVLGGLLWMGLTVPSQAGAQC